MKTKVLVVLYMLFSIIGCRKTFDPYANDPTDPDYFYNRPVGASARLRRTAHIASIARPMRAAGLP